MQGVLALGDSTLDVPRSWAWWLAEAAERPLTRAAVGGSRIGDVIDHQFTGLDRVNGYWCVCLSIGANDVAHPDWSLDGFLFDFDQVIEVLLEMTERVLVSTLSLALRQVPMATWANMSMRTRVAELNDAIAGSPGIVVVPAGGLRSYRHLQPDMVHFTDAGQAEVADRAARLLGLTAAPSSLHTVQPSLNRREWRTSAARGAAMRHANRLRKR